MDRKLSERYFGACMVAKRTTHFLPAPPKGLQRRHIYILKTCYNLKKANGTVKISDIAQEIGSTLPSVTKNIAKLEELGYMKKQANEKDRRVINVEPTEKGLALYQQDVYDFHEKNTEVLQDIPTEDIETTIRTIERIYEQMNKSEYHEYHQKGEKRCIEH
ncbi:MarR family winged helix-turn-helix transcriptional regulator [Enterococcus villorum]|uniref:HTH marR-type domain-containing protein n=2 Tax=Enterococcus villorum TaxID=112904 RepID=A0A511IZY7_9ENTE|nr:MarR family transcriptional regulator [Enterococcus villorum]EOH89000.1 hypothetical protein UAO_01732 [Enterococcus villorum ATCC 700913]EOW76267.1 hypothetical protein I591_01569 [Enterococcus villorum ATCC 700913]GEL91321.1 hypothetical protein EVI01_06580 [Enterococcus villorum]